MTAVRDLNPSSTPSGTGCVECEATGSWWFHLRRCAACGHIGCCDQSLNRHATAHFSATGHRYEQSYEPGEDWFWDFIGRQFVRGPRLPDPQSRPSDQSVPGPASRVPADWRQQLESLTTI